MRRPLHILPTPSFKFAALCAVALIPAAIAWGWRPGLAVACAVDAVCVVLYFVDVVLWRRERVVGVDVEMPPRSARCASFALHYTLRNDTARRLRAVWRHDLPDVCAPEKHSGTVDVAARATHTWQASAVAQRRGELTFDPPVLVYGTPLGLGTVRVVTSPVTISVLPSTQSLQRFDNLIRLRRQHEMGLVLARQRGEGSEIVGLRPYRVGDPPTRIDWKATARLAGPLVSREVQAERRQNIILLLDCGRRMAGEIAGRSRLDYAVEAALLLTHVASRADDKVGMLAFADTVLRVVQPVNKAAGPAALASALFDLQCVLREPPYTKVAAQTALHFRRRSLMVLFTDAAEPASMAALERPVRFLSERHVVVCVIFSDITAMQAMASTPDEIATLYRMGAAAELLQERSQALERLKHAGVLIVESVPEKLTASVVNRYLEIKARHIL